MQQRRGRPSGTDGSDFSYRMVVDSRKHPAPQNPKPALYFLFLFASGGPIQPKNIRDSRAPLQGTRGSPTADPASPGSCSCRHCTKLPGARCCCCLCRRGRR
ncbi:hypothetical protein ACQJBY_006486 [Aegilops geniculata]